MIDIRRHDITETVLPEGRGYLRELGQIKIVKVLHNGHGLQTLPSKRVIPTRSIAKHRMDIRIPPVIGRPLPTFFLPG
jgi:hypothetical protein